MPSRQHRRLFVGLAVAGAVFVLIGVLVPVLLHFLPGGTAALRERNDYDLASLRQRYRLASEGPLPAGTWLVSEVQRKQQNAAARVADELHSLVESIGFRVEGVTDEEALARAAEQRIDRLAHQARLGGIIDIRRAAPQRSPDAFLREIPIRVEIRQTEARALARFLRLTQQPGSYFAVRQATIHSPSPEGHVVEAKLLLSALLFGGED